MPDGSPRYPTSEQQAQFSQRLAENTVSADNPLAIITAFYGPEARYVDRFENGIGYLTITDEHIRQANQPDDLSRFDLSRGVGEVVVDDAYTIGHFPGDLPSVMPGHRVIRAAATNVEYVKGKAAFDWMEHAAPEEGKRTRIVSFNKVDFIKPSLPGQTLEFHSDNHNWDVHATWGDIAVRRGEEPVAAVSGLVVQERFRTDVLREDQLVEAAAQVLGVAALAGRDDLIDENGRPKYLPLFESIGQAHFFGITELVTGRELKIIPQNVVLGKRSVEGSVRIEATGRSTVMTETEFRAKILPYDMFLRFTGSKAA